MTNGKMNNVAKHISIARLEESLTCNQEAGSLHWKKRPEEHFLNKNLQARWNGKYAGKRAINSKCPRGYLRGMLDGKMMYAHRVCVALSIGCWPDGEIDHINRSKGDNRIKNLRVVTHAENRANSNDVDRANKRRMKKHQARKSFIKKYPIAGIRRQSNTTWSVRIKASGKETHLGTFRCFGAAIIARKAAL